MRIYTTMREQVSSGGEIVGIFLFCFVSFENGLFERDRNTTLNNCSRKWNLSKG